MLNTNLNNKLSLSIIILHYATGAVAFLVSTLLLCCSLESFSGHYFNPKLLTITHIVAIGWGVLIIIGALYQLLPVIVNKILYSNKLAIATYSLIITGLSILSYSFWNFAVGVPIQLGASLLLTGLFIFIINIIKTIDKNGSIESDFILTATIWLLVTAIIGTLMAFNFTYAILSKDHLHYLKIHAHIGIAGWFILLIIGVASKLLPMFLLSESKKKYLLKYSYYLINSGLAFILIDGLIFNETKRIIVFVLPIIIGISLFILFIKDIYKNRVRKKLDVPMKKSMLSFVILFLSIILYLLAFICNHNEIQQRIINATGFSFLMGFITMLILGQTFKTLPFIVWIYKFKETKERKLLPKDLYSNFLLKIQLPSFLIAYSLFIIGIISSINFVLYSASVFLIISAVIYTINIFKIILTK